MNTPKNHAERVAAAFRLMDEDIAHPIGREKVLLAAVIGSAMDSFGYSVAWPSVASLMAKTGYSQQMVGRLLGYLFDYDIIACKAMNGPTATAWARKVHGVSLVPPNPQHVTTYITIKWDHPTLRLALERGRTPETAELARNPS